MKLDDVLASIVQLGVTGSRDDVSLAQLETLHAIIRLPHVRYVHHGDCIGVDATAHDYALRVHAQVIVHPPSDPKYRAWCGGNMWLVTIRPPAGYLTRDHEIVDSTNVLVAVPRDGVIHRACRGDGTCATVRYALKRNRPVIVIRPSGVPVLLTTRDQL